ncbi:hypothetical protein CgunFtcFv8_006508 [Champsocephalus gunnari]|nr:hypothetical protein CgunFtcFv8_006508 [Champsocephalus gunnari]
MVLIDKDPKRGTGGRPVWRRRCPPRLFSLYSGRRITAKKAAKQALKGLWNSSKGIRAPLSTAADPCGPCKRLRPGLEIVAPLPAAATQLCQHPTELLQF